MSLTRLMRVMLLGLALPLCCTAYCAEEDDKKKEEDKVFDEEEAKDKQALDNESGPTMEKNLTGVCVLDSREFTEEDKGRLERVNCGTVVADGKQYILRVSSVEVWKSIYQNGKGGKMLSMQGKLRINGTVFVCNNAFPLSQGSSAPPTRRKRGGF